MGDTNNDVIDRKGLVRVASVEVQANRLARSADRMRRFGETARVMARVLSPRGYPTSTIGDGGSRSSDTTSSTERAALAPSPFANADVELANRMRRLWDAQDDVDDYVVFLLARADDIDDVPVAACVACGTLVDRRKNPSDYNRIKRGLCPPCYASFNRSQMTRSQWLAQRRRREQQAAS